MKNKTITFIFALLLSVVAFSDLQAQQWMVYLDYDNRTATIAPDSSYLKITGILIIPGEFFYNNEHYKVVGIGMSAFENCTGITSLIFPNSITTIREYAFKNCTGLKTVKFGHSLKGIGGNAFENCSGITSLSLPDSLVMVGWMTFSGCSGLKELSLGNQLSGCGNGAFFGCHFDKVVYRGTMEQFCNMTFGMNGGSPLARTQNFYIGDTLVHDLVIPHTVQFISDGTFANCSFLTSVTFGSAVNSIGFSCFENDSNLKFIRFLGETPPELLGNTVFSGLSSGTRLIVPCERSAAYDSALSLYNFQMEENLPYLYSAVSSDSSKGRVELLSTPDCDNPQLKVEAVAANSSYLFSHWQDNDTTNPRTVDLVSDTVMVAYFVAKDDAVPDYATSNWHCGAQDGLLHVAGVAGELVTVSDMTGRILYRNVADDEVTISLSASGVYLVKVGDRPVRKVVSVR